MARDTTVRVRIARDGIIRLRNSINGNPRYRIACVVDPGTPDAEFREFITMSDAGFVYGINNDWRDATYRNVAYRTAILKLTPAGRVRHLEYVDSELEQSTVDMVTLTGDDLTVLFRHLDDVTIRKVTLAIDGGVKLKINEGPWTPPLGEVTKVPID